MDSLPTRAPNESPGTTANSIKSDDSSPRHDPGRGSPPPNCAICLGTCRNKSFTDSCLHQFCFKCLLTWSKVKAECPLCKQNFRSIIHNVRSNHQYEEYMVEQRHTEEISERIDIDNLTATRRFRYRTTLTLPRQNSIAIQQLLLHHYPMVAELFPGPPAPRRRSPTSFRRTVYRYNLWARPLPDFTRRFRDCSPDFYRHNPSQMHRLVPWLNRELHYLLNENVGHVSYVVTRILELLPQYSINSTEFRDTMRRYLGDNTDHFLHELYCFASTPYDMNGYDRHVQYTTDHTISTMVNDVLSSSESDASVDSDIVVVSSSAAADAPPGPSRAAPPGPSRPARLPRATRAPAPAYPQSYITEGDVVIPIETISQSDTDDDSSEVMVVGYIKPPQDRTPEVVDLLGSDSDVIVQECVPSEPEPREGRPKLPVRLKLAVQDACTCDPEARPRSSPSGSTHTPSVTPPPRPLPASDAADARRSAPSPLYTPTSSSSSSDSSLRPSSDSEEDTRKRRREAAWNLRRHSSSERSKRRTKRRARKHRKSNKDTNASPGREKRSKRKSHFGKGVKSSKKAGPGDRDTAQVTAESTLVDQAGTSGTAKSRADTNEILPGLSVMSHTTSEISNVRDILRNTNDISRSTSEVSNSTSGISRGTTEVSHSSSEVGSRGISRGLRELQHDTSAVSGGVSEESHGSSRSWSGMKRKLDTNTRRQISKRLKSVVNVINSQKKYELSNPVSEESMSESEDSEHEPTESGHSDSDDLPLNLSVKGAR